MAAARSALALTGLWLSPALLLAVGPALLTRGARGLWLPLLAFSSLLLVGHLLADPWGRLRGKTAGDLLHHRFGWRAGRLMGWVALAVTGLFVWAQLAALRDAGRWTGWPLGLAALGAGVLLILDLWPGLRRAALVGGSLLLVAGLLLPLAAVLAATDPVWPRVWDRVASRTSFVFQPTSPWVVEGKAVRGVEPTLTLPIPEEQRVGFFGRGTVTVRLWEGGEIRRAVDSTLDLVVRPGDRLLIPNGLVARFQSDRTIPGSPATGPDWAEPETALGPGGLHLAGLAVTFLLGGLGLPPLLALLGVGPGLAVGAVRRAAWLLALLLFALQLWAVYTAWLQPEVYLGGIDGLEPFGLPTVVNPWGWGEPLGLLAVAGIGGGFLAAGLAALEAIRLSWARDLRGGETSARPLLLLTSGLLLLLTWRIPWGGWPLMELALGLAAATLAPLLVLGLWRERLTPGGAVAGLGVGLGIFVLFALLGLLPGREGSWLAVLTRWPALVAAPLNGLAAWLFSAAPRPSRRTPPPRAFLVLHSEGLSSPPSSTTKPGSS